MIRLDGDVGANTCDEKVSDIVHAAAALGTVACAVVLLAGLADCLVTCYTVGRPRPRHLVHGATNTLGTATLTTQLLFIHPCLQAFGCVTAYLDIGQMA